MGLVVTLQHNGTRGLRGCMLMQSTTWPASLRVHRCRRSNALLEMAVEKKASLAAEKFVLAVEKKAT